MEFSHEQQVAFEAYKQGKNVFITGPGGTGKSHLIREIVKHAKVRKKKYAVTAMTGRAAQMLKCYAKTIHSWGHISPTFTDEKDLIHSIYYTLYKRNVWRRVQLLIVDEVSMMSCWFFEALNKVAQYARGKGEYFGGIQLVFCGDFCQLPPVYKPHTDDNPDVRKGQFCFESDIWEDVFDKHIELKTMFRQKDVDFIKLLNNARMGYDRLTEDNIKMLESRVNVVCEDEYYKPVKLFPTNRKVRVYNLMELEELDGETREYCNKIEYTKPPTRKTAASKKACNDEVNKLIKNSLIEQKLCLKVGCQVMCTVNLNQQEGIVNGSIGCVLGFTEDKPRVRFDNGKVLLMEPFTYESERVAGLVIKQLPLVLAWAITIHKSQGASLYSAEMDLGSDVFESGQSYVALSRVRRLSGVYLIGLNVKRIKTDPRVVEYYDSLKVIQEDGSYSYFEEDEEEEEEEAVKTDEENSIEDYPLDSEEDNIIVTSKKVQTSISSYFTSSKSSP